TRVLSSGSFQSPDALRVFFLLEICRAQVIQLVAHRILTCDGAQPPDGGIEIAINEIDPPQIVRRHAGGTLVSQHLLKQWSRMCVVPQLEIANCKLIASLRQGAIVAQ